MPSDSLQQFFPNMFTASDVAPSIRDALSTEAHRDAMVVKRPMSLAYHLQRKEFASKLFTP